MRGKRPDHSAGRTNAPCGLPGAPRGDSRPCEMSAHRDEAAERRRGVTDEFVESPGGISPPGAPRSMHEPLDSHGSRCSAASMAQLPMSEERRICAAKPIKPVACSFGLATQPLEFAARPADDIEINPLQGLVSRVSPVHTAVRNCTRDEGGPFEVGNQVLISSHRKLLSSKAMVVNVAEKSEQDFDRYD